MSYLSKQGEYHEGDALPGDVDCMKRPVGDYKLIADPLSDPSNCWVAKTAQDLDDEKEAKAQLLADLKPVINSVLEILYENPDLVVAYANVNLFKAAVKDRYKTKLP